MNMVEVLTKRPANGPTLKHHVGTTLDKRRLEKWGLDKKGVIYDADRLHAFGLWVGRFCEDEAPVMAVTASRVIGPKARDMVVVSNDSLKNGNWFFGLVRIEELEAAAQDPLDALLGAAQYQRHKDSTCDHRLQAALDGLFEICRVPHEANTYS